MQYANLDAVGFLRLGDVALEIIGRGRAKHQGTHCGGRALQKRSSFNQFCHCIFLPGWRLPKNKTPPVVLKRRPDEASLPEYLGGTAATVVRRSAALESADVNPVRPILDIPDAS